MTQAAIVEEIVLVSASMDVARDAAERGDWPKAEQALLDVQERSARLLPNWDCRAGPQSHPTSRITLRFQYDCVDDLGTKLVLSR